MVPEIWVTSGKLVKCVLGQYDQLRVESVTRG